LGRATVTTRVLAGVRNRGAQSRVKTPRSAPCAGRDGAKHGQRFVSMRRDDCYRLGRNEDDLAVRTTVNTPGSTPDGDAPCRALETRGRSSPRFSSFDYVGVRSYGDKSNDRGSCPSSRRQRAGSSRDPPRRCRPRCDPGAAGVRGEAEDRKRQSQSPPRRAACCRGTP